MMLYGGQDGAVCQGCLPGAAAMGLLSHTFIQLLCSSFFLSPPRPKAFIFIRWNSKMCLIQQKGNYVFLSITALIEKRLLWGGAARLALGVRNSFC